MLRTVFQKLSQFLSFCARNLIKLDVQVSSKKRQGLHINKDKAPVCLREKLSFVGSAEPQNLHGFILGYM